MKPTALITGASVGIGYELAREFARGGYDLVLVARNEPKLRDVAQEMQQLGATAQVLVADLSQPTAPQTLFDALAGKSTIDVLVNNAGFGAIGRFDQIDLPRQLEMIQVNVTALVHLTHLFLPGMIQRGRGGILNVASTAAFLPGPWMAIYYATKAFVLSFTEALAQETRKTGVKVTALCPGPTHSEFRTRAKMETSGVFTTSALPVASAQSVARVGFRGFLRGKRIVIPGIMNKIGVQGIRLTPRRLVVKVTEKINRAK